LEATAEGRVCIGIGTACFNGDRDFFSYSGELLCHPVPTGKHGMFSYFENPSHKNNFLWEAKVSQIDEMMRESSYKASETSFLQQKSR
jgi:hypothetical protein